MGVVTVKATAIGNADQQYPQIRNSPWQNGGNVQGCVGQLAVGVGDSAGSKYRFARVSSGCRVDSIKLFSDAITGFTSASVGVYNIQDQSANAGSVVNAALFGSGIDLSVAQTEPYDVIFNNLNISNMEKRVWELLGLSSDPQIFYDIAVTSVTQSGGAGNLAMSLHFVD